MSQAVDDILTTNELKAVVVNTNDLHPAIKQGWGLLIEPDKAPTIGEYILVKFRNGSNSIKLLLEISRDGYLLQSITNEERIFAPHNELIGDVVAISAIVSPSSYQVIKTRQLIKYEHCLH